MRILVWLLLFCPLLSYSQIWPKKYYGTSNTWVEEIIESYDKGYLILSQVDPGTGVPTMHTWLIKTDINGEKVWEKKIFSQYYTNSMNGMDLTDDGGLIQIGSTTKLDSLDYDVCFTKLNACGEKEWCTIIPTQGNSEFGIQIKEIPDGYLGLVSYFRDWVNKRIWLIKLDKEGNEIWEKFYANNDSNIWSEECRHLLIAANGDYIISGYDYYLMPDGHYHNKPLMIRADTAGNEDWILTYGISGNYEGYLWSDIAENDAGFFYDGTGRETDSTELPAFIKVSPQGEEVYFVDIMQGTTVGGISTLNLLNNDTLFLGCAWKDSAYDTHIGIIKSDTLGNISKTKILLENVWRSLISSKISIDGKWVGVGSFEEDSPPMKIYFYKLDQNLQYDSLYNQAFTYDSLCPHPVVSDTINLDDCNIITSVDKRISPEIYSLKAYPSPCTDRVTFELPEIISTEASSGTKSVTTVYRQWKGAVLEIFSSDGKKMYSFSVSENSKIVSINVTGWNPGVYAARLEYRGTSVALRKFVVGPHDVMSVR